MDPDQLSPEAEVAASDRRAAAELAIPAFAEAPTAIAVTFFGVRGSSPCSGPAQQRIGGNTSCVAVDFLGSNGDDRPVLFFDFGTGARDLAARYLHPDRPFEGVCLLTHAHWDHIQGIPFFPPLLRNSDDRVTVVSPRCETGQSLHSVLNAVMSPPMFPVSIVDLPGQLRWVEAVEGTLMIAGVEVLALLVPHTGRTMGYRITAGGMSVTYIPDHQQPLAEPDGFVVAPSVRRLAEGTDLLIFDAQYTREEFARKADWGHSTVQFAAWLAQEVGAKRLAMFHHDPAHDDEMIDRLVARARAEVSDVEVFAAAQGLTVELSSSVLAGKVPPSTT